MKKKTKMFIALAIIVLILFTFYFIIIHPRVRIYRDIQDIMSENNVSNLGVPAIPYTHTTQPDADWVEVRCSGYTLKLPPYYDPSEEVSTLYYPSDASITEHIFVHPEGRYSSYYILNPDTYDEKTLEKLTDGYEQLGLGMPDDLYHSLKAMLSVSEEYYDFWDINKAMAYRVLVLHRVSEIGSFSWYMNGANKICYYYESEDIYFIAREEYFNSLNEYMYTVYFYHPGNLHYEYSLDIQTPDPEVAFAIINSIEFYY